MKTLHGLLQPLRIEWLDAHAGGTDIASFREASSRCLRLCVQMLSQGDEAELLGVPEDAVMEGALEKKSASDPLGRYRPRLFTLTHSTLSYPGAQQGRVTVLPCAGVREITCPHDSPCILSVRHSSRTLTLKAPTSFVRDAWADALRYVAGLILSGQQQQQQQGGLALSSIKMTFEPP